MYYEIIQWSKDARFTTFIHIGRNNVLYKNLDIDASILAGNIIKIGNKCIDYGVVKVAIPSFFVKKVLDLAPLLEKSMMNRVFYVPLINLILS